MARRPFTPAHRRPRDPYRRAIGAPRVTTPGPSPCPNTPPCTHPGLAHDIHDTDHQTPRCYADGCDCGKDPT
jgi:hypothetical protein